MRDRLAGGEPAPGSGTPVLRGRRRASRIGLIRLESARARGLVLVATLIAAAVLAWSAIRPAVAEWMAREATELAPVEWAAGLDPDSPDLRTRTGLALAERGDPEALGLARGHLEAALRRQPSHGFAWFRLARILDRQGDRERARAAVGVALREDPHNVALRWETAALFLEWDDVAAALDHLRYVVAVDPAQRHAAFHLIRRLAGPAEPLGELLPAEPDALASIVAAGLRDEDIPLARAAWERRVALAPVLPESIHRGYLELLLARGDGEAAAHAWSLVAPGATPPEPGNAIWDGGFEEQPLVGWGLGWRSERVWGVQVTVDRAIAARGQQSLRLAFNSFPNLQFRGVRQMVPVQAGRSYRLEAFARAEDFSTRSGLKLQVVSAGDGRLLSETESVSGTTAGWVPVSARVDVPGDVHLVQVVVCREQATAPEGNLGGRVWLDEVSLAPALRAR
jgi:tetratricopeptide (TPR) repeat protein